MSKSMSYYVRTFDRKHIKKAADLKTSLTFIMNSADPGHGRNGCLFSRNCPENFVNENTKVHEINACGEASKNNKTKRQVGANISCPN